MLTSFRRTNFLSQIELPNGIKEYDLLLNNWDLFEINDNIKFGNIKIGDLQRPDYLSYRIYGTSDYWWILCKVNQIDDIWNDLYIGMDIILPSKNDIKEFYKRVRKRLRK